MSGIDDPGTPPEVPEEYAAVYRDAYLRALAEDGVEEQIPGAAVPETGPGTTPSPAAATATRGAPQSRFVLIGAGVLLVGAVTVGAFHLVGDDPVPATPSVTPSASPRAVPTRASSRTAAPSETPRTVEPGVAWEGPVAPVPVTRLTASCTADPGVDSAGDPIRYAAANAIDGDPATAWRCDGKAIGQSLTLVLPDATAVAEVGLVPGYAKTDPSSGVDRYAENNRITRVRWTFEDGASVVQELDPDPRTRALQVIRVPRTSTGTITLEILAVAAGARNTTAISELSVAAAS